MKLSVVIPVYNGADFIKKSYHSILSQDIQEFEIIYVDNNSQDDSVNHIKNLIEHDARISLHHQNLQGAGPTRNLGISKAKGEYIYLFDVDDDIFPDAIKTMISVLDSHSEVDAVFGKMIKSHKGISDISVPTNDTLEVVFKEKPYWGLKWFSNLKYVVGPPAFLYRASVFKLIGTYNTELRLGQDTAFDIKLGMLRNIAFLDMHVYLYFKHNASTTEVVKQNTPRAFMVWPRLVKEHLPFYLNNETPTEFNRLLYHQLFQSMGRQLVFTQGFSNRKRLKQQLYRAIKDLKIPVLIRLFLSIIVILPSELLRKVYGYHVVPYSVKQLMS